MKARSFSMRKQNNDIFDFYETPEWATLSILNRVLLSGSTLEPCSGHGAIARLIKCDASDIRTNDEVFGKKGVDLFSYQSNSYDNIITNPPFRIAQEVIQHSLKVARKKVLMLLRLSFLESARRHDFFKETPLKTVFIFSDRVTMYEAGAQKKNGSGVVAYAWFLWERGYEGYPTIEWIKK